MKNSPKLGGGADSIENYFSKIGGGGLAPPKLAGGKPHDTSACLLQKNDANTLNYYYYYLMQIWKRLSQKIVLIKIGLNPTPKPLFDIVYEIGSCYTL